MDNLPFLPSGRFIASNLPLYFVIATAWKLPPINQCSRLAGAPEWLQSETYEIEAVAEKTMIPPGMPAKARVDRMELMLRSLLEDRFKLSIHQESREMTVSAIVASKIGVRLQKATFEEKTALDWTFLGMESLATVCKAALHAASTVKLSTWAKLRFGSRIGRTGRSSIGPAQRVIQHSNRRLAANTTSASHRQYGHRWR